MLDIATFIPVQFQDVAFVRLLAQTVHALRVELLFFTGILTLYAMSKKTWRKTKPACKAKLPPRHVAAARTPAPRPNQAVAPASARAAFLEIDSSLASSASRAHVSAKDFTSLIQGTADSAHLKDPAWLLPRLVQLFAKQPKAASAVYRRAIEAGLDLRTVPAPDRDTFIIQTVSCTLRQGMTGEAMDILRDLEAHGLALSSALHASVVKLYTAKHCFRECLQAHEMAASSPGFQVADKAVWSCLVFCAVEAQRYDKCAFFFEELKKCGEPTQKDYWNMIRMGSFQADHKLMLRLIGEMQQKDMEIDNVVYNTTFAACVAADRIDTARELLDAMEAVTGVADVITYNTLIKGYATNGHVDDCFTLYNRMRERGLAPSAVTFGILLDGCINDKQCERAAEVFESMKKEGCAMNTVLCTTLIKGFAREGKVEEAMRVYVQMIADKNSQPDLITYSILMKSNCDAGRLEDALDLLQGMLEIGLTPDEVVFNSLLSGCANRSNVPLAQQLYKDMVACGIRPSNATFSIIIRLYSSSKLLDLAIETLRSEPPKHDVQVEPRLYAQLLQSCVRMRQGKRAIEVYNLMAERSNPNMTLHSSVLATCVKLNMFETGVEILDLIAIKGGRVDAKDAHSMLEVLERKHKTNLAEGCLAAMGRLGIEPPLRRS
jgi:pentatricopeptide repeat protein